ncbi:MAG: helix-turn-helix transcriptional regulator [Oscillospiraceae bacterium]|nr:helix-turn-helix transcriptional regulator [Oscillospiraceae bacterium]
MNLKETIVNRVMQICNERGIKPNELAVLSGITPSTVYSFLDSTRNEFYISTIKKLCDGLEITLGEFFSTSEFDNLEQEIK